jgi:hypothetical protein
MTNATMIDIKQTALQSLEWAFKSFGQDLEALPEEAFDKHFGGKARTVADFVHEVVVVNEHIRLTIAGEELFEFPSGWITAPEDLRTKRAVIASFKASGDKFMDTVKSFTQDQMLEPIQSDDKTTNRFERCRFVSWHNGYHSGQLNYVQTLLGDDGWHWS